ncbi:hypothetical protein [Mesobacillus zeae]
MQSVVDELGVALKQSLIKLIQKTLINEHIERACFEKKLIKTCP